MKNYVDAKALQEYTTKLVAKLKTLFPGTPTPAATVAEMTDHNKTYVYVGTESGYTAGDWYYWNGTAWASGGPFQATSIITDTTLAVAGEAADAKATGDAIAAAKAAVLNAMAPAYSPSATYAVGAYVNHNGAIYRCTTAITTAEAWTEGHWAAVPLGADLEGQVSDLKTQLSNVENQIGTVYTDWVQGTYRAEDGTTDNTPTTRARLNTFVPSENFIVASTEDYEFLVYAWDSTSENYVGALRSNDTFSPSGTTKWVQEFDLSGYPSYKFKLAVRNKLSPSSNIDPQTAGENVLFSIDLHKINTDLNEIIPEVQNNTADIQTLGNNLDLLGNDMGTVYTEWEQGTYRAEDGSSDNSPTTRARLSVYVPAENYLVKCSADYEFLVYAWNNRGVYIGALRTDDTFKKNGTTKWVQEFDLSSNGEYLFKFVVRNKLDPSANINPQSAGENVTFTLNLHKMDSDIANLKNKNKKNYTFSAEAQTLAANTELVCCSHMDNKKNDVTTFKCDIGSGFQSVIVGHGFNITYGNYVKITGTVIIVYTDSTAYNTFTHSLTLTDYLYCEIIHMGNATAKIRIYTNGGSYEIPDAVPWRASRGNVFAKSADNALTNCELCITFTDLLSNIFIFGDSYVSIGDNERWTYYLVENGYIKNMIFGYGGAKSADELLCFKNAIAKSIPKYCVWCMGMNDPDSGAINANFKAAIDEFITICEANNIIPILATIPCCPVKNNAYKNAYIKNLGYRYIDFAKAVNAETAGSTWYTGMIASDNEHPNANGAKALYTQALIDFPEITLI